MMRFNNIDLYHVNYQKILSGIPHTELVKFKNEDIKRLKFKMGRYLDIDKDVLDSNREEKYLRQIRVTN